MRDLVKLAVGLVLAALLFLYVFKGVRLDDLGKALRHAWIPGLILSAALQFGHNGFRILRWRWLLSPVAKNVPVRPMFTAVTLGYMVTWIVPGRLGEFLRPAMLSAREDIPLGPCMGTVLIDRILDGFAILVLFSIGILVTPFSGTAAEYAGALRGGAVTAVVVLFAVLVALVVASSRAAHLEKRWGERRGIVAWFVRVAVSFSRGGDALRHPRALFWISLHSLAAWVTVTLGVWIGLTSAGVDVSFGGVLVMQPMLALGIAIPTPAGAGGFHAVTKAALVHLFHVGQAEAVGAAILLHLTGVVPVFVVGAVLLWIENLSLRDLRAAAERVRSLGRAGEPGVRDPLEGTP